MKSSFILSFLCVFSYITRVFDGEHFDDIRRDIPLNMRPPSLVAFFNPGECKVRLDNMELPRLREKSEFPTRANLLVAYYDMSRHREKWYNFYPDIHDLPARFRVTRCPTLVFVDKECPIFQPCDEGYDVYDESQGDLTIWVLNHMRDEVEFFNPLPENMFVILPARTIEIESESSSVIPVHLGEHFTISPVSDASQDAETGLIVPDLTRKWGTQNITMLPRTKERDHLLSSREYTTCNTHVRNTFIPGKIPLLATGIKKIKIPEKMWTDLLNFLDKNFHRSHDEAWGDSQTQLNYYERNTRLIYLDWDYKMRDRLANDYIRPIIEEWSGINDLKLTAFYGIREYVNGSWLRGHIDRLDTHVLSATMTIRTEGQHGDWPLVVVMPDGRRQEISTEPGSLVLYESAKIIHGRPSVFNGKFQYSCFVHFSPLRPVGGRYWKDIDSSARRAASEKMHLCNKIRESPRHSDL